jgi:hypothetical protein
MHDIVLAIDAVEHWRGLVAHPQLQLEGENHVTGRDLWRNGRGAVAVCPHSSAIRPRCSGPRRFQVASRLALEIERRPGVGKHMSENGSGKGVQATLLDLALERA